jgi:hypothetical protein
MNRTKRLVALWLFEVTVTKKSVSIVLFLIVIMAISSLSLLMIKPAVTQSIPAPSVPQFTFTLIGNSSHRYYVQNVTVATIKNNGASYYNFRYKWHDTYEWSYYPFKPNDTNGYNLYGAFSVPNPASSTNYTEIVMNDFLLFSSVQAGLLDIQIQGLFGSYNATPSNNQIFHELGTAYDFVFNGTVSDWSSTQTLQVDGTNLIPFSDISSTLTPTATPNPTSTPALPEFPTLIILPLFATATLISIVLMRKITKNNAHSKWCYLAKVSQMPSLKSAPREIASLVLS